MKSIILSVKPQEAVNILNGKQTIIIKKSAPKETPFKVYLYCTKDKSGKIGRPRHIENVAIWRKNFCPPGFISAGGKVVAEFVCSGVEKLYFETTVYVLNVDNEFKNISFGGKSMTEPYYNGKVATIKNSCLTQQQLVNYGKGKTLYGWHISDLKVYDEPKDLDNFTGVCKTSKRCGESKICSSSQKCLYDKLTKPPATWMYVNIFKPN